MPDPRFFKNSSPKALGELAALSGAELARETGRDMRIEDVAPLDTAGPAHISFLDNIRYRPRFERTQAGACIVSKKMVPHAPDGTHVLISSNPYKSYALVAQAFYPHLLCPYETPPASGKGMISENAHIHPAAVLGAGCLVEPGVVIGENAYIGENCRIEANAVIGAGVKIGIGCIVGAGATVTHTLIGDAVRIYPGCRIGQDGFGFAIDPAGHVKVPQLGRVIIEDHVEIGANTTIDRGAGPDTVIGAGSWIDNLVQIGHNVKIGKGCVIVAQVGISGSTKIGDYAVLAGQVGVAGHLEIGKGARIAAQSGIMRDVPPGEEQMGSPAMPIKQFMRQVAALKKLAGRNTDKKKSS